MRTQVGFLEGDPKSLSDIFTQLKSSLRASIEVNYPENSELANLEKTINFPQTQLEMSKVQTVKELQMAK